MEAKKIGALTEAFKRPTVNGVNAPADPADSSKWGYQATGKKWKGPKWARFRLFIKYPDGSAKYHSWDYTYKFMGGTKVKMKSEMYGLTKLLELATKKYSKNYEYMNIFCNVSADLCTAKGNFDYLICTITENAPKWKWPIFWQPTNELMTDVKAMVEYKTLKLTEYETKSAARQITFNKILSNDKTTAKQV